jgi:uncharacterized membrane protein YdbT with pleckstrin-like domain
MPDNARFCSQCGAALWDKHGQAAKGEAEATPQAAAESPARPAEIALVVPLIAAAVTGYALLLIAAVPGLLWSLWTVGRMLIDPINLRYWLTTDRLFIRRGILRRTTDQTELIRVDDIRVHQGIIDRVFGIGNVEVDCESDITDAKLVLAGVDDPTHVAELVRTGMQKLRRARGVFVEKL